MFKKTLLIALLMTSQAWAQQTTRENDKLDIKKLEQKYWSAKDDDFSVVQNRKYIKKERFYLTGAVGSQFNDAYSEGIALGAHLGYFFNERWGVEVSYEQTDLDDNEPTKQFQTYGAKPDHNKHKSSYFLSGTFVPFYAKMSVLDQAIIYFDMGITAGVGLNNYEIQTNNGPVAESSPALKLGIFQQIFFSENFAIRADFTNMWSSQKRRQYTTFPESDPLYRKIKDEVINDASIMIGITYWH